jgi:hypothetical protein
MYGTQGLSESSVGERIVDGKLPKHCGAKFSIESNPAFCAIHHLGAQPDLFRAQK